VWNEKLFPEGAENKASKGFLYPSEVFDFGGDPVSTEDFKRRLTAILSADVEGYSRLMREDEEATVHTITAYRTAMIHLIEQYRGRVVDSPGDNILSEFTSVVDAVNCGVEIQRELAERNAELSDNRKMRFRIGINLGDILEEWKRIYGDGVNIAARMEGLAEAGEICISGTVYDAIESKIGLEYEYLGEHDVKNIDKPIRAYRVLSYPGAAAHRVVKAKRAVGKAWRNTIIAIVAVLVVGAAVAVWHFYFRTPPIEPASREKMAFPLPDKPSIAVLPFTNMSGDPKQEYFSDGLTEEIITALSRVPQLFVIARNSTFTYKGKAVKIKQVAEDFGVQYVLEGSVRKSKDRIRITAQLIDALNGRHLWAERYDRDFKGIFVLQDEVTLKILRSLLAEVGIEQKESIRRKITENLESYLKVLQGRKYLQNFNPKSNAMAHQVAKEVIALDPNCAAGPLLLAWAHLEDVWLGSSKSPPQSLDRAMELAKKSICLDESLDRAYLGLSQIYLLKRQHDKAIAEGERAIDLNPNSAMAYEELANCLNFAGRPEEAIPLCEKAIRLNPKTMRGYFILAMAYRDSGRYEEAITASKKALSRTPDNLYTRTCLTSCYSLLGREKEARDEALKVLKINPNLRLDFIAKTTPYKDQSHLKFVIDALRKAGLK
jgi:adenylate cyclase